MSSGGKGTASSSPWIVNPYCFEPHMYRVSKCSSSRNRVYNLNWRLERRFPHLSSPCTFIKSISSQDLCPVVCWVSGKQFPSLSLSRPSIQHSYSSPPPHPHPKIILQKRVVCWSLGSTMQLLLLLPLLCLFATNSETIPARAYCSLLDLEGSIGGAQNTHTHVMQPIEWDGWVGCKQLSGTDDAFGWYWEWN